MARNPLQTKLCDMLGIEFPIIAFTHCKDVVIAVVNAGGFAVLGEAMHTPDEIATDIKWIRDRIGSKPFGIDLVLPASVPPAGTVEELIANIPEIPRKYAQGKKDYPGYGSDTCCNRASILALYPGPCRRHAAAY